MSGQRRGRKRMRSGLFFPLFDPLADPAVVARLARNAALRSSPAFRHRPGGTARVPRLLASGRLSLEATR